MAQPPTSSHDARMAAVPPRQPLMDLHSRPREISWDVREENLVERWVNGWTSIVCCKGENKTGQKFSSFPKYLTCAYISTDEKQLMDLDRFQYWFLAKRPFGQKARLLITIH